MQVGIYLDKVDDKNKFLIEEIAKVKDHSFTIFLNNFSPIDIKCPIISSTELWNFNYPVIAESFLAGRYLLECPVPTKKYLIANKMEWMDNLFYAYDFAKVYKNIPLFSFDDSIIKVVDMIWQVKPKLIQSLGEILNVRS